MTAEEIGKLSLADLEAIAVRFEGAVRTIREAQALLGGVAPMAAAAPVAPPRLLRPSTKGLQLTPDELAQREALMADRRASSSEPEFPPGIAEALGGG